MHLKKKTKVKGDWAELQVMLIVRQFTPPRRSSVSDDRHQAGHYPCSQSESRTQLDHGMTQLK